MPATEQRRKIGTAWYETKANGSIFSFHLSRFDTQPLNSNIVPCVFVSFLVLNGAVSPSVGIWCDPPKKNNHSMTAFILPVGIKIIIIKKHVKLMPDILNSPPPFYGSYK